MNRRGHAVRIGLARGWTEFRQGLTNPPDLVVDLVVPAVILVTLSFLRDTDVPGSPLPVATLAVPGVVGMLVAYGALISPSSILAMEREDGTLLRARALPHGLRAYLTGQVVRSSLHTLFGAALVLVPAMLVFDGVGPRGVAGWLTLLGVTALGLLAVLPLGLAIGALADNPRSVGGLGTLVTGGLVAVSGVFYPITALAGWLQAVGQVFPIYWIGLGMRAAFLPDPAATVEIGGSWRSLEMVGVLGAWAVLGLLVAPVALRRMARRESGAGLEARRQAALQRM
jgi:ABC-2 type transport system permease protein